MSYDCDDCDENAAATVLSELEGCAWDAFRIGDDDRAESINRELCEARVHFADLIDFGD